MHQNHPTFFILQLAISKIGAIPSFINTNLTEASLFHCIQIADTKLFLFDPVYAEQVSTVINQCQDLSVRLYSYGENTLEKEVDQLPFAKSLTPDVLSQYSDSDTSEDYLKGIGLGDAAYLIYTR